MCHLERGFGSWGGCFWVWVVWVFFTWTTKQLCSCWEFSKIQPEADTHWVISMAQID